LCRAVYRRRNHLGACVGRGTGRCCDARKRHIVPRAGPALAGATFANHEPARTRVPRRLAGTATTLARAARGAGARHLADRGGARRGVGHTIARTPRDERRTMSFVVLGWGTAVPPHAIDQGDAATLAAEVNCRTEKQRRFLRE